MLSYLNVSPAPSTHKKEASCQLPKKTNLERAQINFPGAGKKGKQHRLFWAR